MKVPYEPELCGKSQGIIREVTPGRVHPTSKAGNLVKPDSGRSKEKWQDPSVRGLPEVERSNDNRRVPITVHGRGTGCGRWTRGLQLLRRIQRLQPNSDAPG